MAKHDVFKYVTKNGFEYVSSAKIFCSYQQGPKSPSAWRAHTLAKKLDAVHKNTVTIKSNMPSVRRATFSSPTPALKPRPFKEAGRE
jgi:hypothetical protein